MSAISGLNLATVGIHPSFWAHVPMTIQQLHDLKLVDGIFCWSDGRHHVPVMKCLLVGCIVSQTIRASDNAGLYVLDDGTGLVDCLVWAKTADDLYHLPLLTPKPSSHQPENWELGDTVRVFGKIRCVAIRDNDMVVKDVQATLIDRVSRCDVETKHWQACIDREESMARNPEEYSATKYLNLLGPSISTQVRERRMLPAKNDKDEEWRVFGTSCSCCLRYKLDLLYCHCIAGVERLDPQFAFRDVLLEYLLELQSAKKKALSFFYKDIKIVDRLRRVAFTSIETTLGNKGPDIERQIDGLFKNTFRWLRTDGIIYLLNENFDQYLFINRRWVLEPYIRNELKDDSSGGRNFVRIHDGPPYLGQVHPDKLLYIRRCLSQQVPPTL
jgi:hypothetical protein